MSATVSALPLLAGRDTFEIEADTLRALANPKRLMILSQLTREGRSVSDLATVVGISLPNASQHLRVLRDRGVVEAERVGQVVRYRLTSPEFQTCCALVRQTILEGMRRRQDELRAAAGGRPRVREGTRHAPTRRRNVPVR